MVRKLLCIIFASVLSLAMSGQSNAANHEREAPVYGEGDADAIPGRYIVVLRAGSVEHDVTAEADNSERHGGKVHHKYSGALHGFAATLSRDSVKELRKNPNIEYIEVDRTISVGIQASQPVSTWNLDRIDQRNLPLDGYFGYTSTGTGVTAYIIDTGIRTSHTEFTGRASVGYDAVGDGQNGIDCNGHGTHVAGTVGGFNYGVAKNVSLVAVRVLNCSGSGTTSGVIAGVNWVTNNARKPAVANMSLGGGASTALDSAVKASIAKGVTYAIAAGNSNANACNYSPARVSTAITVGATTNTDARASYSNYGSCLDLFAPGSSVTSAWSTSDTATNTISGTSMATPNVVGVAALYLQNNPAATPAAVAANLTANATSGVVKSPGTSSPNRMLFTNY